MGRNTWWAIATIPAIAIPAIERAIPQKQKHVIKKLKKKQNFRFMRWYETWLATLSRLSRMDILDIQIWAFFVMEKPHENLKTWGAEVVLCS